MPFAQWVARHELWLLAASAPLLLLPNRWTPLALGMILLTWGCRRVAWGAFTVHTPADAPLIFLGGMALVGLFAAVDLPASMGAFWQLVLGIALFYGLANGVRDQAGMRRLAWGLVAAGLALALLTVFGTDWRNVRLVSLPALYDLFPQVLRALQDNGGFNPRVTGMALAILLPVLLSLALFADGVRLRLAAGAVAAIMALLLPLTQAVQALLGLSLALCCLALWRTRWFLIPLLLGAGLAVWVVLRFDLRPLAARLLSLDDVAGIGVVLRLDIWSRGVAMLADMPFTGVGLDSYTLLQTSFYPGFLIGAEAHAHSLLLQIALDLGVPGLVAFLWLLAAAGVMAFRAYRGHTDPSARGLALGLAAGLVAYLGAGLIDTPWATRPGILLWVLLGGLAALDHLAPGRAPGGVAGQPARGRSRQASLLVAGGLAALLLVGLWAFPGVRTRNLGMLVGHKAVYSARAGQQPSAATLATAADLLRLAATRGSASSGLYSLLGSVAIWQGDYAAALAAFVQQVQLDLQDSAERYIPHEALRRRVMGEAGPDRGADLERVYMHWMTRYPQRAEPYLWAALLRGRFQANPTAATAALQTAPGHNVQPRGVIDYFLVQFGGP